ncbi:hypothetical protein [Methyloglobulus sp.]|uniref:hypothetical protein n=1 Tax=Methyloglobulus sp. TaxID=2518622 RepID=UPI003988DEF8
MQNLHIIEAIVNAFHEGQKQARACGIDQSPIQAANHAAFLCLVKACFWRQCCPETLYIFTQCYPSVTPEKTKVILFLVSD